MNTVRVQLREHSPVIEDGEVVIDERGRTVRWQAPHDDIDLDRLSPRARALAQAIAATDLATVSEVWVESDQPRSELMSERDHEASGQTGLDEPIRRPFSAWSRYKADDPTDPHDWLERQAAKIPAGWHVMPGGPRVPAPDTDTRMTIAQVISTLRDHNVFIKAATWRGYVARDQAPRPKWRVGSTPLWDPADVLAWLEQRPGRGARTDLTR